MSERKLVTIRTIDEVVKHPGADVLDIVKIGGWQCVSKLGTFKAGDRCVYVEIDAFVPVTHPAFAFLEKQAIKWNGKGGARIKTIRLRGEISQGLVVPVSDFPELEGALFRSDNSGDDPDGLTDLAPLLGIEKWERALPANLAGVAKGNFPSFLRKTDQERVQNYWNGFGMKDQVDLVTYKHPETGEIVTYERRPKYICDTLYEVTIKLDGSSMTAYWRDGEFGVCSRNLDLVESAENTFWKVATRLRLKERMAALGRNLALQGELCGPQIQGNNEGLTQADFYLFDIFDINQGRYLAEHDRMRILWDLRLALGKEDADVMALRHVPLLEQREFDFATIEEALEYAEGRSMNLDSRREGVVFKAIENPDFSFKIISNEYLLAHGDR